ncbi:hypothetical protein MTO96_050272 [Rhipicephalus appendiculatus]
MHSKGLDICDVYDTVERDSVGEGSAAKASRPLEIQKGHRPGAEASKDAAKERDALDMFDEFFLVGKLQKSQPAHWIYGDRMGADVERPF